MTKFFKINTTITILVISMMNSLFLMLVIILPVQGVLAECTSVYGCSNGSSLTPERALIDLKGIKGVDTSGGGAVEAIIQWTNFALGFVGVIAIAYIIYGGFLFITSGDSDDRSTQGRKMVVNAIIGIIIIISSYAIVNTFIG